MFTVQQGEYILLYLALVLFKHLLLLFTFFLQILNYILKTLGSNGVEFIERHELIVFLSVVVCLGVVNVYFVMVSIQNVFKNLINFISSIRTSIFFISFKFLMLLLLRMCMQVTFISTLFKLKEWIDILSQSLFTEVLIRFRLLYLRFVYLFHVLLIHDDLRIIIRLNIIRSISLSRNSLIACYQISGQLLLMFAFKPNWSVVL